MKESDRGMFENEWENAFEGAEMAPSETVWSKVEVAVANNEGKNYKRSLLFFKLLAAASVSFAMSIAGWQLYDNYYNQENSLELNAEKNIESPVESNDQSSVNEPLMAEEKNNKVEKNDESSTGSMLRDSTINNTIENPNNKVASTTNFVKDRGNDLTNIVTNSVVDKGSKEVALTSQNKAYSPSKLDHLDVEFFAVNGKFIEPKMVPWLSNIQSRNKDEIKGLWAGVGMSAGSFSSSNSSDVAGVMSEGLLNSDLASVSDLPNLVSEESNGNSYSFGLNIGTQISKRFVLMSGLSYVQQSTTSNSNIVALNTAGYSAVSRNNSFSSESSFAVIDAYKISNTYELLSVPVQAGYILLDRKFNILLLSGVSNDIFLRQTIADESGRAQSAKNNGSDKGYSVFSFSGLIGSEFSYDIAENYILSLQPQLRQTINSFTPEGSKPTYFEVGFKFKYIIK